MTKFRYMQEPPKDLNFVNLLTNANNKIKKEITKLILILVMLLQSIEMGNLQETKKTVFFNYKF